VFVVVGQAAVGEQMAVAGVQEQFPSLNRRHKVARSGEVFRTPWVILHHVDLEWNFRRP